MNQLSNFLSIDESTPFFSSRWNSVLGGCLVFHAFSVLSHPRDVPAQESLATSPAGHTAKVSGRRDAT